jgi:hypothetical protein
MVQSAMSQSVRNDAREEQAIQPTANSENVCRVVKEEALLRQKLASKDAEAECLKTRVSQLEVGPSLEVVEQSGALQSPLRSLQDA